jgi:hypothetical protein
LRLSWDCAPGGLVVGMSGTESKDSSGFKSRFPETAHEFVAVAFKEAAVSNLSSKAGGDDALNEM